jgi:gliding motility-associated protein GldC
MKKTNIVITVCLDQNKIPEKMSWTAKDGGIENQKTKAFLFSSWDDISQETMKIDLWTKDMPVDQMNVFFHQTLVSLSQSYLKATNNEKMNDAFNQFCDYFAEKLELRKK